MALSSPRPTFQILSTLSRSGATTQLRQFYLRSLAASSSPQSRHSSTASTFSSQPPSDSTASSMSYYGRYASSPLSMALDDTSDDPFSKPRYRKAARDPFSQLSTNDAFPKVVGIGTYRPFHSSPLSQATGDSSTIDYMKFPDFDPDLEEEDVKPRPPLLPDTAFAGMSYAAEEQAAELFERPEIITASAVPTHIPSPAVLSDMSSSDHVLYEGVAATNVQDTPKAEGEEVGTFSRVLKDMISDLLGPAEKPTRA